MEHPDSPLPGPYYACLGAQPHSVAREHLDFVRRRGGVVVWKNEIDDNLDRIFATERDRLHRAGCQVYVTIDADVVQAAEVPGVSAPNPLGLRGQEVASCARLAGLSPEVSSIDLVEINPAHDRDGLSVRWGSVLLWHFLVGLANRTKQRR